MKITIEARSLSGSMGVRTYTQELINHLTSGHPADYTVILDAPRHVGTFVPTNEVVIPLRHELLLPYWLEQKIPRYLRQHPADVVHFTKAAVPRKKTLPTVVTIYDVIPLLVPTSQKLLQRWYWPHTLRHAAHASDHILTISQCSKRDIVEHLQVDPAKITVTSLAANTTHFQPIHDEARITTVLKQHHIQRPYILFVGTLEPRKNIPALIRAFTAVASKIPHTLVIAGKKGWKYQGIFRAVAASAVSKRISFIDQVPYDHLPVLMSAADAFVWPSIYEGSALPVLEAMACGTPVIVSDGGPLPEVVGQAGEIVPFSQVTPALRLTDSDFEERLAQRIEMLLTNTSLRASRRYEDRARASKFSWQEVANQTFKVYEEVAKL